MVHKNMVRRNIQSIQHARMNHAYCVGLNPGWKKMRFQLALNKTFYPTHQRLKQLQTKPCFLHPCSPPLPPPPHRFSTQAQSSQYQNWKANKCSIITVNEQGPPVISNFLLPLILNSNLQFNKTKIENCPPIGYNLGSPLLRARSYNHYTMFIRCWREPWGFKYPSIKSWNNPGKSSFLWNCAGAVKSHTHHLEQKPTIISFIIYKHYTNTKLRHLARGRSEGKLSNPWDSKNEILSSSPFLISPD